MGTIDTFFEFPSPEKAEEAYRRFPELHGENSAFARIGECRHNGNSACLEMNFEGHTADLPLVAQTLGAIRVTHDFKAIWPP